MLRLLTLLLLIANALYFAWSHGYFSAWGFPFAPQTESFRLNEQIEPERIVIKSKNSAAEAITATAASPSPIAPVAPAAPAKVTAPSTVCVTAGVFNERQSATLKQALNTKLPDLSWRFDTATLPARWIVYMGKYPNNAARDLKKSQLDQLKVRYEVLTEGNLEPGLSLGSHPTQAQAEQSLKQLIKQGVRTARVLEESPEQQAQNLVIPAIDEVNLAKLNTLYAAIAKQLGNKTLHACK